MKYPELLPHSEYIQSPCHGPGTLNELASGHLFQLHSYPSICLTHGSSCPCLNTPCTLPPQGLYTRCYLSLEDPPSLFTPMIHSLISLWSLPKRQGFKEISLGQPIRNSSLSLSIPYLCFLLIYLSQLDIYVYL